MTSLSSDVVTLRDSNVPAKDKKNNISRRMSLQLKKALSFRSVWICISPHNLSFLPHFLFLSIELKRMKI